MLVSEVSLARAEHDVLFRWEVRNSWWLAAAYPGARGRRVAERIPRVNDDPLGQDPTASHRAHVSIGCATAEPAPELPDELLHRADPADYRAKAPEGIV